MPTALGVFTGDWRSKQPHSENEAGTAREQRPSGGSESLWPVAESQEKGWSRGQKEGFPSTFTHRCRPGR